MGSALPKSPGTAANSNRKRVVIAGLGDVGVLTAIRLTRHADVVGISVKPALVSGQELGIRLARPRDWARDYWIPFDRFRRLDRVTTVHAALTSVDLAAPGVSVYSTLRGNSYGYMSGTSMAAPFVTGAVALVHDLHPTWTYRQIINDILTNTDPVAAG